MKKILCIMTALLAISANIAAQKTRETVYLTNGSIIKGQVEEVDMQTGVKVRMSDGSLLVFTPQEVQRIAKEPYPKSFAQRGYRGFEEFSAGPGIDDWDYSTYRICLSTTHGYQKDEHWFFGLGVSVNSIGSNDEFCYDYCAYDDYIYYDSGFPDYTNICVFGNVRYDFVGKPFSPFVEGRLGGAFSNSPNGIYAEVGAGLHARRFNFTLAADIQSVDITYDLGRTETQISLMPAVIFRIGFDFGGRRAD